MLRSDACCGLKKQFSRVTCAHQLAGTHISSVLHLLDYGQTSVTLNTIVAPQALSLNRKPLQIVTEPVTITLVGPTLWTLVNTLPCSCWS